MHLIGCVPRHLVDWLEHLASKLDEIVLHSHVSNLDSISILGVDVRHEAYCELANFGVIDTQYLRLFVGTKVETGDQIHTEEDDAGASKRICTACNRVGDLIGKLDPVVIEPSTSNERISVQVSNVVTDLGCQ